jgi:hypothetical protein
MCKAHYNRKQGCSMLRTKRNSLIAKAVVTRFPTPDVHLRHFWAQSRWAVCGTIHQINAVYNLNTSEYSVQMCTNVYKCVQMCTRQRWQRSHVTKLSPASQPRELLHKGHPKDAPGNFQMVAPTVQTWTFEESTAEHGREIQIFQGKRNGQSRYRLDRRYRLPNCAQPQWFSQHLSETCSVQMVPASGVPSFALPRAPRVFPSFCSSRITWSSLRPAGQEQWHSDDTEERLSTLNPTTPMENAFVWQPNAGS